MTASSAPKTQDVRGSVLQRLPRVQPLGVLVTEFDDVGKLHNFFESGRCVGMAAEKCRPDVGVVGNGAFIAELLENCLDRCGAGREKAGYRTGVKHLGRSVGGFKRFQIAHDVDA